MTGKIQTRLTLALFVAGTMNAAIIDVTTANGIWTSAVATNPNTAGLISGVGTSQLRWGAPTPPDPQSGFDFDALIPPTVSQVIPPSPGPFFDVGTFTHINFQVGDNSGNGFGNLTAQLQLTLNLTVDSVAASPVFLYQFALEETNNLSTAPAGCTYGGTVGPPPGCNDRVVLTSLTPVQTFLINGVQYSLELRFLKDGVPATEFITQEFTENEAFIQGRFTALNVAVPEPQTYALMGLGLLGFAFRRRLMNR